MYASKNMTTGEGGVVTTNDAQTAETVRMVRTHGEKAKYASECWAAIIACLRFKQP
jgi:dTDP-4-amino-4,6-dideoxygalactose transaminase